MLVSGLFVDRLVTDTFPGQAGTRSTLSIIYGGVEVRRHTLGVSVQSSIVMMMILERFYVKSLVVSGAKVWSRIAFSRRRKSYHHFCL